MEPNKEGGKNMTTMLVVAVAVIIAIGGGIYLLNNQKMTTTEGVLEENTEMMESNEEAADTMMDSENVKTFTLEGGAFYYNPNEIRVKKGDTVKVVLNSVDMMHDFVIDELDVRTPIIKSGDTGEVTFVADTAGEYEFYCSVGSHRQQGMVGTLIVEE